METYNAVFRVRMPFDRYSEKYKENIYTKIMIINKIGVIRLSPVNLLMVIRCRLYRQQFYGSNNSWWKQCTGEIGLRVDHHS